MGVGVGVGVGMGAGVGVAVAVDGCQTRSVTKMGKRCVWACVDVGVVRVWVWVWCGCGWVGRCVWVSYSVFMDRIGEYI